MSTPRSTLRAVVGTVFAVDETATHDGPGLRMTVYLKGCPLRCVWCHSPESQAPEPEIVWYATRCQRCGACVEACPQQIRSFSGDGADPAACELCERCVEACSSQAVEVKGQLLTAGELADRALRLKPFYVHGGGVTLTGGEPTFQPEFCLAALTLLHEGGLHTALETTGLCRPAVLDSLRPVCDLFLFDLKHADDALHRRDTGVSNERILANLAHLTASGAEVLVRVPCIPGHNDDPATIKAIARTAAACGVRQISLLPYNPATPGKYAWLNRDYPLGRREPQSRDQMEHLEALAAAAGLQVVR
ncbi:MAG: glycyl-radical enzyme activating protein [Fimbriimonadaceae bacterium]|nr:glycyl-radical enzyme activating protein [Fimbriimonadaceae bacterium]